MAKQASALKQDMHLEECTAKLMLVDRWVDLNFSESMIDQVRLYAADRFGNRYLCPLVNAVHNSIGNVLPTLLLSDD